MQVECPGCNRRSDFPDDASGQVVTCPGCGGQMQLPAMTGGPVPAAGAGAGAGSAGGGAGSGAAATKTCRYCGEQILAVAQKCKHCGSFLTGPRAGRAGSAPASDGNAVASMVLGIVGLVLFCVPALPLVCGGIALRLSGKALESNPGNGVATAGKVLGIISLIVGLGVGLLQIVGCLSDM